MTTDDITIYDFGFIYGQRECADHAVTYPGGWFLPQDGELRAMAITRSESAVKQDPQASDGLLRDSNGVLQPLMTNDAEREEFITGFLAGYRADYSRAERRISL